MQAVSSEPTLTLASTGAPKAVALWCSKRQRMLRQPSVSRGDSIVTTLSNRALADQYHGFEWYGRVLEVREDRYAGLHGSRGRGGAPRGLGMGGRGGGFRGARGGGYERGGRFASGGSGGGGRDWQAGSLYKDYTGPDGRSSGGADPGYGGGGGTYGRIPVDLQPSQQIMVRNVSIPQHQYVGVLTRLLKLPWSTANEDLVELFETTGHVEQAEILYEGTRSKGAGVVQFAHIEEAETAIGTQSLFWGGCQLTDIFCS